MVHGHFELPLVVERGIWDVANKQIRECTEKLGQFLNFVKARFARRVFTLQRDRPLKYVEVDFFREVRNP